MTAARRTVSVRAYGGMGGEASEQTFVLPTELSIRFLTLVGPRGLSPAASDLVEVAAVLCRVERMLPSWRTSNRPQRVEVRVPVRLPDTWRCGAGACMERVLRFLTGVDWRMAFRGGRGVRPLDHGKESEGGVENIALFSGGLDSACGAAMLSSWAPRVRLVSVCSQQDEGLQRRLAEKTGHNSPCQVMVSYGGLKRRMFLTRSLLFLAVAAAVADSYPTRHVLQYENGVLGLSLAPAPGVVMTRHAHPELHRLFGELCSTQLGGEWIIENPFLSRTKKECVDEAIALRGNGIRAALEQTRSCWYYRSNHGHKGEKVPNSACGVCLPCLVRRTALPGEVPQRDLLRPAVRRDAEQAVFFNDLLGFLHDVRRCANAGEFYGVLDPESRVLATLPAAPAFEHQYGVYRRFAAEFGHTFSVRWS